MPSLTKIVTPGAKSRFVQLMIKYDALNPNVQTALTKSIADTVSMFKGVEGVLMNRDLLEEVGIQ